MFDINEAFIQALQEQELKEGLDYGDESINITTSGDDEEARKHYGKDMTKRNRVRSLDQAKRNLKRAATDGRIGNGQIVDQVSFEDTLNRDLDIYKYRKDMATMHRGNEPKYNKDLRIDGKSKLEPSEHNEMVATMWDNEADMVADKIRAKHNKKQENASITVTQDVNSEDEALDLVNDTSYFNIGDEVEVKDWNGRIYKVTKTKDYKYKDGKRIEETIETNVNLDDTEISEDRMKELMPKMMEFIKENDYKNHYFEDLAQNGMYSRMRIFGGLSDKFYDYVQAYEQVISAMAYNNKTDYVTDLLNYDKEVLNLSNEECPLVTTNLTVRKEIADKLGVKDNAPESIVTEEKENNEKTKLTYKYTDNGQYYYEDEKGRLYVDMSDVKDKTDLYRCVGDYDEPSHSVNAEDFELINNPKNDENYERNKKYEYTYMLLSRLVMDCKYYLGNGNRFDGHLWAGSVDKQIAKMKELWNTLPEDMKPEWLSMEDIENYEREMKSEKKTEAEETSDNISFELNTDLLPILNMSQYNLADDIDISREELNNVMSDLGKPIIEKVIKEVLPNATVTAGEFYNPKYYNYDVDQLDFTVSVPKSDYETLKNDTLSKEDFEQFLQKTYKSYDGYTSTMPKNIAEFNKAKDWEQFVAILSYYIKPFVHQEEFSMEVLDYIWENFPTEVDEEENENIEESKESPKEADIDMYKRIKAEPRTENYNKGLKIKDEIVNAWKKGDLETAHKKWEELFNMFSTGYDDNGNKTDDFSEEQAIRDMTELTMITDEIEDKCVYDVTDYGKQKYYKQMGY